MLTHKTKPKLKKYTSLGISLPSKKKKKKLRKSKKFKLFSPKFNFFFSRSAIRFKDKFSNLLFHRKKLKLLFGFLKTASLKKLKDKNLTLKLTSNRFLKVLEFCSLLERRLDVTLLRLGFVSTLFEAKQLISHKKIYVNDRPMSRAAHYLKKGDIISLHPSIHLFTCQKIHEQAQKRPFYFTQFSNLEINWQCLKFVILREKIAVSSQLLFYSDFLDWESLSNE